MALLTVNGFSYAYGKKVALEEVSFVVEEGTVNVLLGNNGSGKSTILKSIARVIPAKKGSITLLGKDQRDYSPREYARLVAYVPQSPEFDDMTVFDAVLLGRLPNFTSPRQTDYDRVSEALRTLNIQDLSDESVKNLSGGEKQKVAWCRALCSDAKLILLDEPTNNLDLKSKYGILETIKKIAKGGVSVLTSLHDLNESLDLSDSFILLNDKRSVACGDVDILTEELLSKVYDMDFEKVSHSGKIHFHIKEKEL